MKKVVLLAVAVWLPTRSLGALVKTGIILRFVGNTALSYASSTAAYEHLKGRQLRNTNVGANVGHEVGLVYGAGAGAVYGGSIHFIAWEVRYPLSCVFIIGNITNFLDYASQS